MKKSILLLSLMLALAALIIGASVLYSNLKDQPKPNRLTVVDPPKEEDGQEAPEGSKPAPDFRVYDRNSKAVSLSDFEGKPVVLNFWASWCGPCQMEMPDFQKKYQELGDEVYFLMVNMTTGKETKGTALEFLAGTDYTFPVYFDTDMDAAQAYSVYSLPSTYFIDANGYVIAYATGAIDEATLQKGIDLIR